MIDSNNIGVMRENIRKLDNLRTNVCANTEAIGEINSLIGDTPLPIGQTITSALSVVNFGNLYGVDLRETESGILSVKLYNTSYKTDNDRLEIQVNTNTSRVRYLKYVSGEKTFDKSITLS